MTSPTIYASCSSYVLGKSFGMKLAEQYLTQAVAGGTAELEAIAAGIPAVDVLRALRRHGDVLLRVDGGASRLPVSRSRHFTAALESGADVWVTVDDDVSATSETVAWLLDAVSPSEPTVAIAPCVLRGSSVVESSGVVNVEWSPLVLTRDLPRGGRVRRAVRGGFGLVAMSRPAMLAMAEVSPRFRDDDGALRFAPFYEAMVPAPNEDGVSRWLGEDTSFFARAEVARLIVEALIRGQTTHANASIDLAQLEAS